MIYCTPQKMQTDLKKKKEKSLKSRDQEICITCPVLDLIVQVTKCIHLPKPITSVHLSFTEENIFKEEEEEAATNSGRKPNKADKAIFHRKAPSLHLSNIVYFGSLDYVRANKRNPNERRSMC